MTCRGKKVVAGKRPQIHTWAVTTRNRQQSRGAAVAVAAWAARSRGRDASFAEALWFAPATLAEWTGRRMLPRALSSSLGRSGTPKTGILPNEANKSFVMNVASAKVRKIPPRSMKLLGALRSGARSELEAALKLKLAGDDAARARQTLQQMN